MGPRTAMQPFNMKGNNMTPKNQQLIDKAIAEAKAARDAAVGPHKAILDKRNALAAKLTDLRKQADDTVKAKDAIESSAEYAEAQSKAGSAIARLNRISEAAKFVPLVEALAPFRDALKPMNSEQKRGFLSLMAGLTPALNAALVTAVPRSTDSTKHAKITDKTWAVIEAGEAMARELLDGNL
jgi:hypothetical protein